MPMFDRENPDRWILKAERYFNINQFTHEEKVEAKVISIGGEALLLYQWEKQ